MFEAITYENAVETLVKQITGTKNQKLSLDFSLLQTKVFQDNAVDFIRDTKKLRRKRKGKKARTVNVRTQDFEDLIAKIKSKKLITKKLKMSFNYSGEISLSANNINATLELDWNLFERNKILELFDEHGDIKEARNMKVTNAYKAAVHKMLTDAKVDIIQEVRPSVNDYEKYKNSRRATIKDYCKPGSILFTTAGLEMQVISGIKYLGKENIKKQKKIVCQFDYERILINWETILDHIVKLNERKPLNNKIDVLEKEK